MQSSRTRRPELMISRSSTSRSEWSWSQTATWSTRSTASWVQTRSRWCWATWCMTWVKASSLSRTRTNSWICVTRSQTSSTATLPSAASSITSSSRTPASPTSLSVLNNSTPSRTSRWPSRKLSAKNTRWRRLGLRKIVRSSQHKLKPSPQSTSANRSSPTLFISSCVSSRLQRKFRSSSKTARIRSSSAMMHSSWMFSEVVTTN